MLSPPLLLLGVLLGASLACGDSSSPEPGTEAGAAGTPTTGGSGDQGAGASGSSQGPGTGGSSGQAGDSGQGGSSGAGSSADKSATCVSTFGQELGSVGYARFDGTVVAVVAPKHPTCALPNSSHAIIQIEMKGAIYRMVVSMASTQGIDRRIFSAETTAPLPGDPWSDGWHPASLDYPTSLSLHAEAFTPHELPEATTSLIDSLTLGARVSVFAIAEDKPDSAHLVHYNGKNQDGAVVIDPTGPSPRWWLYRFDDQSF